LNKVAEARLPATHKQPIMNLKIIYTMLLLITTTLVASPRKCEWKAAKSTRAKTTAAQAQKTDIKNAALADDRDLLPLHRLPGSIL
jgi:hypothetical protein